MLGQGCERGYQAGNYSSGLLGAWEGPSELRAEGTGGSSPYVREARAGAVLDRGAEGAGQALRMVSMFLTWATA